MVSHGAATARQPEYLLAAPLEAEERAYVVARLMQQPIWASGENAGPRLMFEQLLAWVRQQRQRYRAAKLQQELQKAERSGDSKRVLELLRSKQSG